MPVHITSRSDAEAIIREQVVSTIFQDAPKQSVFMSMARKLPNMTSDQTRIRVLDFLPTAYWVDGDIPFKKPLVTQHTIPYYSTPAGRGQGPIFCRGAGVPFNHGQYTTSGPAKYSIPPQKMIFRRTSGPYFR